MSICFSVPGGKEPPRRGPRTRRAALLLTGVMLVAVQMSAVAQDTLFITVSAPGDAASPVQERADLFTTVSSEAAQPAAAPDAQAVRAVPSVEPAAGSAPLKSEKENKLEQKLLRDPFWPVGFFPPDWNRPAEADTGRRPDAEEAGWSAAAAKIRVSGTSQMAGRTAAIVNGELKLPGDRIEVKHEGRTYGWRISGIEADGRIQLRRDGVNY